jgi:LacI family transcriptional regulator
VLSGQRRHIAPETRGRVLAVASRLDYSPNTLARSLVVRRAPILAALVHDISDPYFGEIARGIEAVAGEREHLVMVCNWLLDPNRLLRYLRLLKSMRVAGVVFCGSGIAEDQPLYPEVRRQILRLRRDGMQLVALAPQAIDMPTITIDNHAAAKMAVEFLLQRGHRMIGHLAGPSILLTARHRWEGYAQALRQVGVVPREEWVEWAGFRTPDGHEGARRLLARAPEVTAIFAANDQIAIGAVAAAEEMGRRVPASLSVVGIGNVPVLPYLRPKLATVSVPARTMGEEGAALLLGGRAGRNAAPQVRLLPLELVARESVTPSLARTDVHAI